VVFTPKSLLRDQRSFSPLQELSTGGLRRVIDDPKRGQARDEITKLLFCTGRIYYDLTSDERYQRDDRIAIARVELLYPFPYDEIEQIIASYPNVREIVWVQEEPKNMGARRFMFTRARERQMMPEGVALGYIGRPYRASPGEGYPAAHHVEQQRILDEALTVG
jgi:2-oxoglutarate dehydrogenase E1 component